MTARRACSCRTWRPNRELELPRQAGAHPGQRADRHRDPSGRSVPLVEVRLRVPFGRAPLARGARCCRQTLFSGTGDDVHRRHRRRAADGRRRAVRRRRPRPAAGLRQRLASGLDRMLEILADVLTGATYPDERGGHRAGPPRRPHPGRAEPAGAPGPGGAAQADVRRAPVRGADARARAGRARSRPAAAARPARRPAAPGRRDAGAGRRHRPGDGARRWPSRRSAAGTAPARTATLPPAPPLRARPAAAGRPARARCSRRCGWRCRRSPRTHPDHAALQLANLVFGGYFSSRWVENIREDKGYTYGPHSVDRALRSPARRWSSSAEVATEVTGPALLETLYELGRLATPAAAARTSWSRPASTPSARCCSACRPRPGWPGWPAPTPAYGLRLDFLAEHAGRAGRGHPRRGRRGGGAVPGAGQGGHRGARRRGRSSESSLAALTAGGPAAGRGRAGATPSPTSASSRPRRRVGAAAGPVHPGPGRASLRTDPVWLAEAWQRGRVLVVDSRRPGAGRAGDRLRAGARADAGARRASGCSSASTRPARRTSPSTRRCPRSGPTRWPGRTACATSATLLDARDAGLL